MSYSVIKAIWPKETQADIKMLSNSHGVAPVIWNELCKKYLNQPDFGWIIEGVLDKIFVRWNDLSIPEYHRSLLLMTYSGSYITKENYSRAANDIANFFVDFHVPDNRVNHWFVIQQFLESNPDYPAIAIYQTSVDEDPFQGDWNDEKQMFDSTNWDKTFDIYLELDDLKRDEL